MPEELLMHSPLSEMAALQTLLAGDTGRKNQLCSPLQYAQCKELKHCLRYEITDVAAVGIAMTDFQLCTPVRFTAQRMSKVREA